LGPFVHVKRVKKYSHEDGQLTFSIILGVEDLSVGKEELQAFSERFGLEAIRDKIPKHAPLTQLQMQECTKIWPMASRSFTLTTPDPAIFTNQELLQMEHYMSLATIQAEKAKSEGHKPVGCVIVSADWKLITQAHDLSAMHMLKHAALNCIDNVSVLELEKREAEDEDSYLCTEYKMSITDEPCVMCSMALLHSRIAMVVYKHPSPQTGGLGSKYKIHCTKSLNHHFHVYKWMK